MGPIDSSLSVCAACKHVFKRFYDLRKHVKKFHADKLEQLAPVKVKSYEFQCTVCQKNFSAKRNFRFHLKVHTSTEIGLERNLVRKAKRVERKCPLCDFVGKYTTEFSKHFQENHDIDLNVETLHFDSAESFSMWFSNMKEETLAQFKMEKTYVSTCKKHVTYICHRSGFFKSKSLGLRHLKVSKKINGYCPAGIQVVIDNERGNHEVTFVKTHVGHQNDLSLTQEKRPMKRRRKRKVQTSNPEPNDQQPSNLDKSEVAKSAVILQQLQSKESTTSVPRSLSDRKEELIENVTCEINSIQSEKELCSAVKLLALLRPTLRSVCLEDSSGQHLNPNGTPCNKKIDPQMLYSIKKINISKTNKIQKPSGTEQNTITHNVGVKNEINYT